MHEFLEEMVKRDMVSRGFDPRNFASILSYWAERLK